MHHSTEVGQKTSHTSLAMVATFASGFATSGCSIINWVGLTPQPLPSHTNPKASLSLSVVVLFNSSKYISHLNPIDRICVFYLFIFYYLFLVFLSNFLDRFFFHILLPVYQFGQIFGPFFLIFIFEHLTILTFFMFLPAFFMFSMRK